MTPIGGRVRIRGGMLALFVALTSSAAAQDDPFHVEVSKASMLSGGAAEIEVVVVVPPGLHVYRDMMRVKIPEPGAFVYRALQMDLAVEDGVPPPPSFHNRSGAPLQVADVNEADYTYYAALFQAGESVSAPPDPVRVVSDSVAFEGSAGDEDEDTQTTAGIAKTKRLSIPAGYAATHASVVSIHSAPQMFVTVGAQIFPYDAISGRAFGTLAIDDEPIVGNVEVSVVSSDPQVPVDVMVREVDGELYVFAVGMRLASTSATFSIGGTKLSRVTVVDEDRTLAV